MSEILHSLTKQAAIASQQSQIQAADQARLNSRIEKMTAKSKLIREMMIAKSKLIREKMIPNDKPFTASRHVERGEKEAQRLLNEMEEDSKKKEAYRKSLNRQHYYHNMHTLSSQPSKFGILKVFSIHSPSLYLNMNELI